MKTDALPGAAGKAEENAQQRASLDEAVSLYWERIWAALYRLTGDEHEAEDLALEVFWRLYSKPPAHAENLGGWLYRTATHLGFNALRSRKRRQSYEAQAGHQALERSQTDVHAEVERREDRRRVRQALARMKPRQAQVLVLRYSGLSYTEIAAALKVSAGSVGTLLLRAEKEFEKQYLKQEGRSHEKNIPRNASPAWNPTKFRR